MVLLSSNNSNLLVRSQVGRKRIFSYSDNSVGSNDSPKGEITWNGGKDKLNLPVFLTSGSLGIM